MPVLPTARTVLIASVALNAALPIPAIGCAIPSKVPASAYTVTHNIAYTTTPNVNQTLDLFLPAGVKNPPIVIWIHGGSFVKGSKGGGTYFAQIMATYGIATANVNYSLATTAATKFPAGISDVRCAASWLQANATTLGFDATRFAVLGESAGGNFAGLLGTGANPSGAFDATKDCAAPYGVPSFLGVADYYGLNDIADPTAMNGSQTHIATNYLGVAPAKNPALAAEASPITYVSASTPPFFIARGTADNIMPQAQATDMMAALQADGVAVQYFDVTGLGHGFDPFNVAQYPALQPSACALIAFFQTVLGPTVPGR
jgi:acetyl esterase/lipase